MRACCIGDKLVPCLCVLVAAWPHSAPRTRVDPKPEAMRESREFSTTRRNKRPSSAGEIESKKKLL